MSKNNIEGVPQLSKTSSRCRSAQKKASRHSLVIVRKQIFFWLLI